MTNKLINDREELKKLCNQLRKHGKKIVTCNGAFDILHLGHIKFLEEARAQGDVLIVGINSDESIKRLKGSKRPINNGEARAEFLLALRTVDYVTVFNEDNPIALLDVIKPDVHVNGEEYGYGCIEADVVQKNKGVIYLVKKYKDFSTTNLIKKILKVYKNE